MLRYRHIVLLCILLNVFGCAAFRAVETVPVVRLKQDIREALEDPNFYNANLGVYIESLKTGEIIYKQNPYKLFMPASNVKLFTTSTALVRLGPDFTYKTVLYSRGRVSEEGILQGDLLIKGSGDPTISGRFTDGNILRTFENWADSLKISGIKHIEGAVIADATCFDSNGLVFNNNRIQIIVKPAAAVGEPAEITTNPHTTYFTFINKTYTVNPTKTQQIRLQRMIDTNEIIVDGTISTDRNLYSRSLSISTDRNLSSRSGNLYSSSRSINNPALYTATVLTDLLESMGITVNGEPRVIDESELEEITESELTIRATYTSPPLSELLKAINKPSDNFYADHLLKTLGYEFKGLGSFSNGAEVVREFVGSIGINSEQVFLSDGSGLSRYNLIMPIQIAMLLKYMRYHSHYRYFYDSLPVAGVDGTIESRMRHTAAENIVHAKTGTLRFVRALSGYVVSKDNEEFIVSILINHYTTPTSTSAKIQDKLFVILANFSRER